MSAPTTYEEIEEQFRRGVSWCFTCEAWERFQDSSRVCAECGHHVKRCDVRIATWSREHTCKCGYKWDKPLEASNRLPEWAGYPEWALTEKFVPLLRPEYDMFRPVT